MTDGNMDTIDPLFDLDGSLLNWDDNEQDHKSNGTVGQTSDAQNQRDGALDHAAIDPSPVWTPLSNSLHGIPSLPSFSLIGDGANDTFASSTNGLTGQASNGLASLQAVQMMNGFPPYALMPPTGVVSGTTGMNPSGAVGNASQSKPSSSLPQHLRPQSVEGAKTSASAQHGHQGSEATVVTASTSQQPSTSGTAMTRKNAVRSLPSGSSSEASTASALANSPATMALAAQQHAQASQATGGLRQLHPLGIPSSANCPQYLPANMAANPFFFANMGGVAQPIMGATNPELSALIQAMQQQQMYASMLNSTASASANPTVARQQPRAPPGDAKVPPHSAASAARTPAVKRTKSSREKTKEGAPSTSTGSSLPPFHLFDAPVELRQNFMQTQRMYNLPVNEDNNSVHYGMAVNGFHPQLNATENRIHPLSSNLADIPFDSSVRLVDGRHAKQHGGFERNKREQKRAHKITQLIDQLRSSMEHDGWEIETKSKYHTLSTCANYVRHLVKSTKDKETAIAKAKTDLKEKERKMEEDTAVSDSRSDPESVTSSLTASSHDGEPRQRRKSNPADDDCKKRKALQAQTGEEVKSSKKARIECQDGQVPHESTSSVESSSGDNRLGFRNISLGKMSSAMSDMTDSNKGSSSDGNKNSSTRRANNDRAAASSVSSTAVVVRGEGSQVKDHGHADVVIERKRKRQHREKSSVDKSFEVDFEEVFLTSNVPQLIATPAGRIVTCNDFFLKATGLTMEEVSRLTIFSIVQADQLANLFEMVAVALQTGSSSNRRQQTCGSSSGHTSSSAGGQSSEGDSGSQGSSSTTYKTMTLPCISFPASESRKSLSTMQHPNPLYMTITLMPDSDPRKRCFHCMITDCPGTNGAMGFVTPELLSLLFTDK